MDFLQIAYTICLLLYLPSTRAAGLCELETGESNIILDIEESRESSVSQETTPPELPISGEPNVDIFLDLSFPKGPPIFFLNGKKLQLLSPLDRDEENLSHIVFQLICTVKATHKKRTVPVIVRLTDINDNAPQFVNTPYETSISELTPVGTTIFQNIVAKDKDTGVNALVEYSIVKADSLPPDEGIGRDRIHSEDGFGFFAINLPHQGQVTVNRTLDFEKTQRYYVTVVATDRARDESQRLSSTTTLTVNIKDDDDLPPSFIYKGCMLLDGSCINPEYTASVSSGVLQGILNISPEKIQAVDMDTINSPIRYSFVSGTPDSYGEYFRIDQETGAVHQTKPVDTSTTKKFEIIIKAQEVSEAKRSTTAKLFITVKPVDAHPPEIQLSSVEGYVDENSPIGEKVLDSNGRPLVVTVEDKDFGPGDPKPSYTFELTTPYFAINKENQIIVNENNLDRDPPNPGKFKFQVVAREKNGIAASPPTSVTVHLRDVNDNPPVLPIIPPVSVPAGDVKRKVTTIQAADNDEGENAEVRYSIYHVSNNGNNKFVINPTTGELETVGKLNAGDQYSLTVQATDKGGLYSQAIVEVTISPGPNTQAPVFEQSVYDIEVSEGATINSTVATIAASDPEGDPVTYSIVSGNDLRQFAIGSKTGIMTIIRQLDREDLNRYQLMIKAEDSGKLSSTVTVNIKVTDINDKNPEFVGDPYKFSVKEGLNRTSVGFVHADDADEGINARVTYLIPADLPFDVDNETGEITTNRPLDYETQKEYQFVVTAKDGAPDPRIATATVSIEVIDVEDELPVFVKPKYEATVPENMPDYFVAEVKAEDPDTIKKITYVIHQGPTDLFRIDESTGEIFTSRGLDYEKDSQHVLVIGTLENMSSDKGSTTKVVVNVEDRNDIPPVFTIIPHPITLEDDVTIGTTVITLVATDSDGTAPGNKVRYEIIGRGKSSKYFQIDPDTGVLRVTNDLKKEVDTEYQVDVRAYDLGDPQLSSVITVDVYIQHVATVAPEVGLRFADTSYSFQVPENATTGYRIKTLTIVNSRTHGANIPLKCQIISGNKEGKFFINVTEERNCALYLNDTVDYETQESYEFEVEIMSLQGFINKEFAIAQITVNVVDVNDNKPYFIFPSTETKKYFAAISTNSPLSTTVTQVKADDKDSGKFGKIKYSLSGNYSDEYFVIDATTGIIRTKKSFQDVEQTVLPFQLSAKARDNPNSTVDFFETEAPVVVNLISQVNRIIMVIGDAKPDLVQSKLDDIARIIQEQSGLVVGVEKLTAREFIGGNGTLETDQAATDVWFYVVDPETETILPRNNSLVKRLILEKAAMDNITFDVTGQIKHNAFTIHEPLAVHKVKSASIASFNGEVFPYALIIIGCIIFVLGIVGIIYICISWSRYKSYKEQMQRQYTVPASPARYDTVYVEPNLKEYETQVLQMCVPVDDQEDYNDLHLDFSNKNHAFSLDNVSYISKDNNLKKYGQQSPVSSESATTARASSVGDGHILSKNGENTLRRDHIYNNRSSDEDEMNTSPTNENVMFKEKKDYLNIGYAYGDHSPVETTTEL
ncbi:cadherin-99C [Anoplophora glabripennis]|uniref:cadherin-99C n=1 Tax=Anoplophora glabripennis TaxID=217634 RepID=UPI0008759055|nr:cadherin-99C [Anoplophora glabripennis]